MQKVFATVLGLSVLSPVSASANWFWSDGINCNPLDQACLVEYALDELQEATEEVSVNTFGKMLGNLWPHLDGNIRHSIQTSYLERPDGELVVRYTNIAIAGIPPDSDAVQPLSELLDNPTLAGDLPLDYWGQTLADKALRSDPAATADLAIAKGEAFSEIAIDGLYRTITWMARNDLGRLEAYLEAHNPRSTVYFSPSAHLFRVAAELCDNGQDGKSLAEIALKDLLSTRISSTERFAIPMRAVVACDGMEAAYEQLDDMFLSQSKDLERQKARGQDGIFMIQRIVRAVNDDGLAPVLLRLHDNGQNTEAIALAGRLLPEAQVVISIDEDREVSIEESQAQARLADIIAERANASSNLDPNTALLWFTKSFVPEDHISPDDFAVRTIDPILRLWPDPIAKEAANDAIPLLAASKFKTNELLRLKTGIALADAENCVLAETALRELLDQIADQKSAAVRVLATADYLSYLDKYDATLPECTTM